MDEPLSRLLPDKNVHVIHLALVAAGELDELLIHGRRNTLAAKLREDGLLLAEAATLRDFSFVGAYEPPADPDAEIVVTFVHFLFYLLGAHRAFPSPALRILVSSWPDLFEKPLQIFGVFFAELYDFILRHGG